MWRIHVLFTFVALPVMLLGQTPQGISYQGVVRENGNLIANQSIEVEIRILKQSILIYRESHIAQTNDFGLFSLIIGEGDSIFSDGTTMGDFLEIDWSEGSHELHVLFDSGSGQQDMGTQRIVSVPYSLFSAESGKVENLSITDTTSAGGDLSGPYSNFTIQKIQGQTLNLSNPGQGQVLKWNGSEWGPSDDISDTLWSVAPNGLDIFYENGNVEIGEDSSTSLLSVNGSLEINNPSDDKVIALSSDPTGDGILQVFGNNSQPGMRLTATSSGGDATLFGNNNNTLIKLSQAAGNSGFISTHHSNNNELVRISISGSNTGGYMAVNNISGIPQAGIFVDGSGLGSVFADVKSFRMTHPKKENKEIWYASLEGPEAGAYLRGTSTLVNGTASISFPEHFELVANSAMMTITVTPLSAQSKGLAVISKSDKGFVVQELLGGEGTYQFDWVAMAVRKGYENFEVLRETLPDPAKGVGKEN